MKSHNNILLLSYDELVPIIITETNYKWHKRQGNIIVHGRGGNGREVLIEFETLPARFKELVRKQYGDPYLYLARQPFIKGIDWDHHAQAFYNGYVLPNCMNLPETYVEKYTKAASWLNTICRLITDKRALKRELNIGIGDLWSMLGELIQQQGIALPASDKYLRARISQYKLNGYESLIECWRFGNENSKKVKDEVAEALLLELIAHPHQHDDTVIAKMYNSWANETKRSTITSGAVGYWRRNNAHLLTQQREGKGINYNKYSKRILRNRPSAPLLLINSDDNILDLYFKDPANNKSYYRPALYVVIDAYNDYILGYAIGDTITVDLIKAAYRNAQRHVMELTGKAYLWQQIQTDHWGISGKNTTDLEQFLNDQAKFTPTALKNAQGKYIERSFGTVWHQHLKLFPNYSGHNITAKERINPDAILSKAFPDKEHMPAIVNNFIEMMRGSVVPKNQKSRQQEWLDSFHASDKSKKVLLDDLTRLQKFGIKHRYSNRITAAGLQPVIMGQPCSYDIPAAIIWEHNGKKVQVTYDPIDLSKVLVSDGEGLRFLANKFEKMPSAIADYKDDSRKRLDNYLEEKTGIMIKVGEEIKRRAAILEREGIDASSILQAGVMTKTLSYKAQRTLTGHTKEHMAEPADISLKNLLK